MIRGFPVRRRTTNGRSLRAVDEPVWYLVSAKDDGHGFAKKTNADFEFLRFGQIPLRTTCEVTVVTDSK